MGVEKVWDDILAHCPKVRDSALTFPTPQEIEKMVCEVATKKQIESKAVGEICQAISEKFHPVPECQRILMLAWDGIVAKCPKGRESALTFPSPEEIEKLVCEVATQKQVETKAVGEICQVITEKF